jgi:hypothetical protein
MVLARDGHTDAAARDVPRGSLPLIAEGVRLEKAGTGVPGLARGDHRDERKDHQRSSGEI